MDFLNFEYWYMFPVAIIVSTVAISSGVSGATFFTPMFFLWLGLPLRAAIGAALMTATFGFASGLSGYARLDLRLTDEGHLYVIEANATPDIADDEDFALSAKKAGLDYPKLLQRILNLALGYRPSWKGG